MSNVASILVPSAETSLSIAAAPEPGLKLDLGCGQNPKEGFEGVDLNAPNPTHRVDLFKFPFPWADNSVDEIHCSHFAEHIPARDIEERDLSDPERTELLGKDFLFAFMDECYRVLRPGGKMVIQVPCGRNDRAFQDPTHRRFFVEATFGYFSAEWRKANSLDHYRAECDFGITVVPIVGTDDTLRHQEVQNQMFRHQWNKVHDLHATLISKKPGAL